MPEIKKILPQLSDSERSILAANFGENAAAGYPCDFFYLPARLSVQTMRLCNLFSKVFCEIAIPTILGSMDYLNNWEDLPHYWTFHGNYVGRQFTEYNTQYYWFHPFKFSIEENRNFILNIFHTDFYDKANNE